MSGRRAAVRPASQRRAPAAGAPSHVYVWYRVVADPAAARATVRALFADVESRTGVCGRLLARRDDPSTWMEVYEPVARAGAFARTLAACVRRHDAAAVAENGERHCECFAAARAPTWPLPARRA